MGNKKVVLTISITVLLLAIAVMGVFYITENRKSKPVSVQKVVSSQLSKEIDINSLKCLGNAKQAVIVTADGYDTCEALVRTYEKGENGWKAVLAPTEASVGSSGFAAPDEKEEGDGKSPSGAFGFGMCFGNMPNPGTKLSYRQIDSNCYWVDDPASKLYNTFQTGPADGRWKSAENLGLTGTAYDYAAVINYNTEKRIPGKGSAIFMHVWGGRGKGTAGCTAMPKDVLISVLKWLDPAKNPIIIQGTVDDILKM